MGSIAASNNRIAVLTGRCFNFAMLFIAYFALFAFITKKILDKRNDPAALTFNPKYVYSVTFSSGAVPIWKISFLFLLFFVENVIHFDLMGVNCHVPITTKTVNTVK